MFEIIYHVWKVKSLLLKADNHSNLCVLNTQRLERQLIDHYFLHFMKNEF
jgi:hypothetical protein